MAESSPFGVKQVARVHRVWILLLLLVLALGTGVAAGYVRWRRPHVELQAQLVALRPPTVSALNDARPSAVIDLKDAEAALLVRGQWRYMETARDGVAAGGVTRPPEVGWTVVRPGALDDRGRAGRGRAAWYRIDVVIPERLGDLETRASTVVFELAVDGYAEIWVDGKLVPVLGTNGAFLVTGTSARNRVLLTRGPRAGQRFEITVLVVDRALAEPPVDAFSIRSATLDFVGPPETRSPAGEIVRLDPAFDAIVAPTARLEKVAEGLRSGEGPVWMPDGYLLVSDFSANLIYRWNADDGLTVWRTKSGYAGLDFSRYPLPGANGLAVDAQGRLTIAEHGRRRIVRLERNGDVTVLAASYQGRRFNSPNDLVYRSNGDLYFTDPPFGLPKAEARELPFSGVFRWRAGRLDLLTSDLGGPNGLAFSPDERLLYVAEGNKGALIRFDVQDDGTLANERFFFPMRADGLKVDRRGNVYAAAAGVTVISPSGKILGVIRPAEGLTNLAWGDDDDRTLYLVGGRGIYRIRLEVPGSGTWRHPKSPASSILRYRTLSSRIVSRARRHPPQPGDGRN